MTKKEWALRYARAGWSIFPAIKKEPHYDLLKRTGHKKFDRTKNEWHATYLEFFEKAAGLEEIERWWTMEPDADIKLCCGRISGVTIIDIDKKQPEHDDPEGIRESLGVFSMTSITGSGVGRHYFCKYQPLKSGQILTQVEIKNDRTTITLPPSGHVSGKTYGWDPMFPFDEQNLRVLAPVPKMLLVAQEKKGDTKHEDWIEMLTNGAKDNERNITGTKIIGKAMFALFIEFKGDPACIPFVWDFALTWNSRNSPPMDEKELMTITKSVVNTHFYGRS